MDIVWATDCKTNSDVVAEDTRLARNSWFPISRVIQMIILFYGPGGETCFNCSFYFLSCCPRTVTVPGTDRRLHKHLLNEQINSTNVVQVNRRGLSQLSFSHTELSFFISAFNLNNYRETERKIHIC